MKIILIIVLAGTTFVLGFREWYLSGKLANAIKENERLRAGNFTFLEMVHLHQTSGFWEAVDYALTEVKKALPMPEGAWYQPSQILEKALLHFKITEK